MELTLERHLEKFEEGISKHRSPAVYGGQGRGAVDGTGSFACPGSKYDNAVGFCLHSLLPLVD